MTDKAAIYIRVSTEEQANPDKTSLASQEKRCRGYSESQEWEVVEVYEDPGISGTLEPVNRPALKRLLDDAAEGMFKRVVFLKIDRLARNLRKLLNLSHELDGEDVGLVSVEEQFDTTTASGQLFFNLLGAFAEFEAEQIKERMTNGRRAAVATKGKYLSSKVPYGYDREDGHIKINRQEAKVVRRIFRWARDGEGLKTIGKKLDEQHIPPPNANAKSEKRRAKWWWHTTVYKILTSKRYIGESSYAGTPMPCPAIVDDELFYAVQQGLSKRKKDSPRNTQRFYLLQHVLYCRYCATNFPDETGHRYMARIVKRRGRDVPIYLCRRRQAWGKKAGHEGLHWNWDGHLLEMTIKRFLLKVLVDREYLVRDAEVYVEEAEQASNEQEEKVERLTTQLDKLEDQERRVLEGYERGVYKNDQQAQERLADVRAQLEETKVELETLRSEDRSIELTRAEKVRLVSQKLVHQHAFPRFVRGKGLYPRPLPKGWVDKALADLEQKTTVEEELFDDANPEVEGKVVSIPIEEWWRNLVTTLIDRIWVEDDGRHLTVEGIIKVASGKLEVVSDDQQPPRTGVGRGCAPP